jgi:predicted NUDIX family NTP pyrophosphohydrolase
MDTAVQSAGLLMFRNKDRGTEVFLCRPFSIEKQKKRLWGIPKGRIDGSEMPLDAAKREFYEETGLMPPDVPSYYLGKIMYPSGKKEVSVWTFEFDPPEGFEYRSNLTKVKDSNGRQILIPEVGEWKWFGLEEASRNIMISQREILERFLRFMGKNNNSYGEKINGQVSRESGRKDKLQGVSRFGKTEW